MKKSFCLLCLFFLIARLNAQDFNCRVQVNHTQVQNTSTQVFRNLETSINEFINTRKWKSHDVAINERLDLNIIINISRFTLPDLFNATIQIQAGRPVYGSGYNSQLFNHEDNDFTFTYVNFQPMDFNEQSFTSNLTSVLGFYAHYILGLEADALSLEGGSSHFDKANNILVAAQSSGAVGWQSSDGRNNRNRFWMIENVLNDRFKPFRKAMYLYHRKGLDIMYKDLESGRNEITNALKEMQKVSRLVPNSALMRIFFNAKADEIVGVYSKALTTDKNKVIEILKDIDPASGTKWDKILSG